MEAPTGTHSVKFSVNCDSELKTAKKQRLAIRTDLSTLKADSDYPFEPTSALDLESCRGRQLDGNIEEDIEDYETQEKEFRRKNKWSMFSMLWAHQIWWIVVLIINLPALLFAFNHLATAHHDNLQETFAYVAVANLTVTILVRNELLLTCLYYSFNYIPFWKFQFHRMLHSIGGLHVSAGIAAFVWVLVYMSNMYTKTVFHGTPQEWILYITVALLALCLFLMIVTALRPIRERYHNVWEYTHRFVGWFSLVILIIHVSTKASMQSVPIAIFQTPLPYLTIACVVSVFYVWFTVVKVKVEACAGNGVAIIKFPGRPTMKDGTFARVSRDFLQWHSFSVAMTNNDKPDFAIIVGAAGDWTRSLVESVSEGLGPEKMWIRGINPPGFMTMHHAYSRVVTLATGAGIAPCLPQIANKSSDIYLLWVAKNHETAYGPEVWNIVSQLPKSQTLLHDTATMGRPNAADMIAKAVIAHRAEAVFVVSNDRYTKAIIEVCWRMGVRCYGATRDS